MKLVGAVRKNAFAIIGLFLVLVFNFYTRTSFTSLCFAESNDFVIATVNEVPIMKSELDLSISKFKKKARKNIVSQDEKKQLVKNLIRRRLILQQESVQMLKHEESIIEKVKKHEEDLIVARFLQNEVGSHLKANKDELKNYYQENRHEFSIPRKVKARHILLRTQEEAEKVMLRLKKGEDFGQLAKDFSIDLPNALEGGIMGTIEKGKILPELETELFTLNRGEVSGIVKTIYGYHILTVDEIIPTNFRTFEEVKDGIKRLIISQKEAKSFDAMAATLEKNADIKIFENLLNQDVHKAE
jgi:peptidyl-prolyl cis-trans isomerase C